MRAGEKDLEEAVPHHENGKTLSAVKMSGCFCSRLHISLDPVRLNSESRFRN